MPWQASSRRRAELPRNWQSLRKQVLDRDHHTCTIRGPRCTGTATHADHIGDGNDHRIENLRAACRTCHMGRTARQAHDARPSRQRATERHPGLL